MKRKIKLEPGVYNKYRKMNNNNNNNSSSSSSSSSSSNVNKGRSNMMVVSRSAGWAAMGEMKYFDTERSLNVLSSSANWANCEYPPNVDVPTTLFCPIQGNGINNRIGKSATLFKIKIKGMIRIPKSSVYTTARNFPIIRLALVEDQQTNAAQAQGENIFSAATTATQGVLTFTNPDGFGRYKVLKDFIIDTKSMDPNLQDVNYHVQGEDISFKLSYVWKGGNEVRFNSTNGGTIADIVDKSWCLYANCSTIDVGPQIAYYARCSFKG